jgi:hypothetical protein
MSRLVGLPPRTAAEQLQQPASDEGIQPLPQPYAPAAVAPNELGIDDPGETPSFFVLGDVGGVKSPAPQNAVSDAIERRQDEASFALILGDVVYFNGQQIGLVEGRQTGYGDQFYEPYAKLAKPIIAFPGNHDGDPEPTEPAGASLAGFMANFCAKQPGAPVDDPQLEYGRHTQTLPYCEWTLGWSFTSPVDHTPRTSLRARTVRNLHDHALVNVSSQLTLRLHPLRLVDMAWHGRGCQVLRHPAGYAGQWGACERTRR